MALDNDVIIKLACYRLLDSLPQMVGVDARGILTLGAARFVIRTSISRSRRVQDKTKAQDCVDRFLASVSRIEPSQHEISMATDIEELALREGLEVDTGESQLLAVVANRKLDQLLTGDKRAVVGAERLLAVVSALDYIEGRVVILEQLISRVSDAMGHAEVCRLICAERNVDKALTICCSCYSPEVQADLQGNLSSYIEDVRREAPRVLMGGGE